MCVLFSTYLLNEGMQNDYDYDDNIGVFFSLFLSQSSINHTQTHHISLWEYNLFYIFS
jgi:hypothetical protein